MKNIVKNFMLGIPVRIPLCLTADPADARGNYGTIILADREQDLIRVKFEDGTTGDYQFNCLETLYPISTLMHGLSIRNRRFDRENYRSIHKIIALAIQGKKMEALKLAYDKLVIEEFCVTTTVSYFEIRTSLRKHLGIGKWE